jgi:hypothetical protein
MDRFDDVSVVASVDESPPAPRVPRRARRAFTGVVAAVVVTGALAGAAVGLADEKAEPSPSATSGSEAFPVFKRSGHECKGERHKRSQSSSSSFRY